MSKQMNGAIVPMIHLPRFSCKSIVSLVALVLPQWLHCPERVTLICWLDSRDIGARVSPSSGESPGTFFSFLFLRTFVQLKDWLGHWHEEIKCISAQKSQTCGLVINRSQWTNSLSQQVKGKGRMIFLKMFHQSISFQKNLMAPCTGKAPHLQSRVL